LDEQVRPAPVKKTLLALPGAPMLLIYGEGETIVFSPMIYESFDWAFAKP